MRHKKGFYEVAPVAGFIARQDWTHTMERAERNGLSLQSQKGSTGLLFSVRILAPILDGGPASLSSPKKEAPGCCSP